MEIFVDDIRNGVDVIDYINAVSEVLELGQYEGDLFIDLMKKCDGDAGGYCYGDAEQINIEIATHVQGEALESRQSKSISHTRWFMLNRLQVVG